MRTNKRTFAAAEIRPRSYLAPIDCAAVFGRSAPLEVDLGCGDGTFLVSLAEQRTDRDFIGVERLAGRVRSACRKIGAAGLTNVGVVQHDILQAAQQLFACDSVHVFHLMFPDPWPKRRHYNRRILSPQFLRAVSRALTPNGELHIATDDDDYFAATLEIVDRIPTLARLRASEAGAMPTSTFQERFRAHGADIHRLVLRKVSLAR